jgi:hypothetical protein
MPASRNCFLDIDPGFQASSFAALLSQPVSSSRDISNRPGPGSNLTILEESVEWFLRTLLISDPISSMSQNISRDIPLAGYGPGMEHFRDSHLFAPHTVITLYR